MPDTAPRDRLAHLTEDQRRAIRTVCRSLLVSAAAGAGKTTVLAERCAYLVCDLPEQERCDIDQLLVVTEGRGFITTEKEKTIVIPGEIVLIPAREKHWHGATKDSKFAYIQIQGADSQTTQYED